MQVLFSAGEEIAMIELWKDPYRSHFSFAKTTLLVLALTKKRTKDDVFENEARKRHMLQNDNSWPHCGRCGRVTSLRNQNPKKTVRDFTR